MEIKFTNHFFLFKKNTLHIIMRTFLLLFCTTVFSFSSSDIFSQNTKIIIEEDKTVTIDEIFDLLRQQTDYTFIYQEDLFKNAPKVHLKKGKINANKLLKESLSGDNFNFTFTDSNKIVVVKSPELIAKEQQIQIAGTVSDASGQPLPGANILEKGTTNGTQTDFDGKFILDVTNESAVLVVSYIGFATQEVTVGSQVNIAITLLEDAASLDEIVVVGYGTQKKKDLTGAVASISSEDFQNGTKTSVDQMLQGKVAGVRISQTSGQPGGGVSIRIRGNSSLNTGNEPLYVIDGMPIDNAPLLSGNGSNIPGSTPPNPLNTINPQDIESVQILKDASATAIYGSRGANGVVIITTKQGTKGKLKIDYNTSVGFQSIARKIDLLNSEQYVSHVGDILTQSGSSLLSEYSSTSVNTDWQDEIYESATMTQHNISLSGGREENKFYSSFNYTDQEGILKGSGFKRFGGRLNWNYKKDKFAFSANLNTSMTEDDITAHGGGGNFDSGAISTALYLPATSPIFNGDGSYYLPETLDLDNPYNIIQGIDIQGRTHRTLVNLKAEYDVIENVKASLSINTDVINTKMDSYRSRQTIVGSQAGGVANILTSKSTNYTVDGLLNYDNTFGEDHKLSALVGYTYQKFNYQFFSGTASGFIGDEVKTDDLGSGDPTLNKLSSSRDSDALIGILSRVNYAYKDKFLFTASYRVDGSSKFLPGNKFKSYPSFSLGYRLSEESFLDSADYLSNLKARFGWGQIGNSRIPSNAALATFVAGNPAVFNDQLYPGLTPSRIPNPDLTWETTEQINFGLDFGFFNNRINGSLDYYNKKTKDLLFQLQVPIQTGFGSKWVNLPNSEITNSGLEFTLNTINFDGEKFGWNSSLNLTTNKNEITKLDGQKLIVSSDVIASVANIEGEAAFSYFGLQTEGIWQTGEDPSGSAQPDAEPGYPKWKDQNNDGVINADDRVILGNPYPDLVWGLGNNFKFGNFELSVFVEGVHGIELYSNLLANTYFPFNNSRNRLAEPIVNRWTPSNATNSWPSFANPSDYGGDLTNAYTIQDASFVRLKNVTLTYNFNIKNNSLIKSLSAYLSGENLAIATDYIGYDPDLAGSGNSKIEFNSYPTSRTFLLGINVGL